jgi:hypothetical protein
MPDEVGRSYDSGNNPLLVPLTLRGRFLVPPLKIRGARGSYEGVTDVLRDPDSAEVRRLATPASDARQNGHLPFGFWHLAFVCNLDFGIWNLPAIRAFVAGRSPKGNGENEGSFHF